jgi:hypothetical protein
VPALSSLDWEKVMKIIDKFCYQLLVIFFYVLGVFINHSPAAMISGTIKDRNGKEIKNALVILEEKGREPQPIITKQDGKFNFGEGKEHGNYKLIAYKDGIIEIKEIINLEKGGEDIDITISEEWLKWIPDKLWTLFGLLISFCLGLFSPIILEIIKRKKIQRNIASVYNESIKEFQKVINEIDREDDEKRYLAIEEKLSMAKSNLENLLSYSWAAEKLSPEFFYQLQKKKDLILQLERTAAFDPKQENFVIKLNFLKRRKEGKTADYQKFNELFDQLVLSFP